MIIFSEHALERLGERSVDQDHVRTTIVKPDSLVSSRLGRLIALKTINGRSLKVIFIEEKDDIIVVTAYWTRVKGTQ